MFYLDPTILLILPGMLLAMWAQSKVQRAFHKYAKVPARSGMTGSQLTRTLLANAGVTDIELARVHGTLTDNFNPASRTLSLSEDVYDSASIAALGVAAHECGHVMQHQSGYAMLGLRSFIVPMVNIGSGLSWPIFLLGFLFSWEPLILAGIVLFSVTVLFTLVTLPVEFNASGRAMRLLESTGALQADELSGARKVLTAASLTYVASALSAILQLARLLLLSGNRRRR